MKRGAPLGYTIVEVMIFLAVTAALFVIVALAFNGRQARTDFATATRDLESQFQDVINDVTTGYSGSSTGVPQCDSTTIPVSFPGGVVSQGTNGACIFRGKVLHLGIDPSEPDANRKYKIYSVAGARKAYDGTDPKDMVRSKLNIIPGLDREVRLPSSMEFHSLRADFSGSILESSSIFIFNSGASHDGAPTGAIQAYFFPLPLRLYPAAQRSVQQTSAVHNSVSSIAGLWPVEPNLYTLAGSGNPSGGLTACYNSALSDQHALIKFSGSSAIVDSVIEEGDCT